MKTVLISGASTGIGYQIALTLANAGHKVFAGIRTEKDFKKLETIKDVMPVFLDVTKPDLIKKTFETIEKEGGINVLICNAGITQVNPVLEVPIELFQAHIDVNIYGAIRLVQAFKDQLISNKGLVVNISSLNAFIASDFISAYCTTKAGMEGFIDTLRLELKKFDVKVCSVYPGQFNTPIFEKILSSGLEVAKTSQYYKKELEGIGDEIKPGSIGREPSIIGNDILNIVNSTNPPDVFISGSEEERMFTYRTIMKKLMNLIEASDGADEITKIIASLLSKE